MAELHALAEELRAALEALLDHSEVHYDDINAGSSGVVFIGWNPHRWNELDGPGQAALGKAREVYKVWAEHTAKAIAVGAPERQKTFDGARGALTKVLRLEFKASSGAPASTVDAVRAKGGRSA